VGSVINGPPLSRVAAAAIARDGADLEEAPAMAWVWQAPRDLDLTPSTR